MNYREALDEVFRKYNIKAVDIASKTGVGTNQISRFRNGRNDLKAETLFAIINGLPYEARMHFYALIMLDGSLPKKTEVSA